MAHLVWWLPYQKWCFSVVNCRIISLKSCLIPNSPSLIPDFPSQITTFVAWNPSFFRRWMMIPGAMRPERKVFYPGRHDAANGTYIGDIHGIYTYTCRQWIQSSGAANPQALRCGISLGSETGSPCCVWRWLPATLGPVEFGEFNKVIRNQWSSVLIEMFEMVGTSVWIICKSCRASPVWTSALQFPAVPPQ